MSGIKLVAINARVCGLVSATEVPNGKTTIGRTFLKLTDKQMSRSHAVLEVNADKKLVITPIHTDPCFLWQQGTGPRTVLLKDQHMILQHNDIVAFLHDTLSYRIVYPGPHSDNDDTDDDNKDDVKKAVKQATKKPPLASTSAVGTGARRKSVRKSRHVNDDETEESDDTATKPSKHAKGKTAKPKSIQRKKRCVVFDETDDSGDDDVSGVVTTVKASDKKTPKRKSRKSLHIESDTESDDVGGKDATNNKPSKSAKGKTAKPKSAIITAVSDDDEMTTEEEEDDDDVDSSRKKSAAKESVGNKKSYLRSVVSRASYTHSDKSLIVEAVVAFLRLQPGTTPDDIDNRMWQEIAINLWHQPSRDDVRYLRDTWRRSRWLRAAVDEAVQAPSQSPSSSSSAL